LFISFFKIYLNPKYDIYQKKTEIKHLKNLTNLVRRMASEGKKCYKCEGKHGPISEYISLMCEYCTGECWSGSCPSRKTLVRSCGWYCEEHFETNGGRAIYDAKKNQKYLESKDERPQPAPHHIVSYTAKVFVGGIVSPNSSIKGLMKDPLYDPKALQLVFKMLRPVGSEYYAC